MSGDFFLLLDVTYCEITLLGVGFLLTLLQTLLGFTTRCSYLDSDDPFEVHFQALLQGPAAAFRPGLTWGCSKGSPVLRALHTALKYQQVLPSIYNPVPVPWLILSTTCTD